MLSRSAGDRLRVIRELPGGGGGSTACPWVGSTERSECQATFDPADISRQGNYHPRHTIAQVLLRVTVQ